MADNAHEDRLVKDTLEAIQRFNDAFNRHDVDAVMAVMTEDCVFENTYPPPDGERYEGQAAVRAFWERFFVSSPQATFETGWAPVLAWFPSPIMDMQFYPIMDIYNIPFDCYSR